MWIKVKLFIIGKVIIVYLYCIYLKFCNLSEEIGCGNGIVIGCLGWEFILIFVKDNLIEC